MKFLTGDFVNVQHGDGEGTFDYIGKAVVCENSGNDYGLILLPKGREMYEQWWFEEDELTLMYRDAKEGLRIINEMHAINEKYEEEEEDDE